MSLFNVNVNDDYASIDFPGGEAYYGYETDWEFTFIYEYGDKAFRWTPDELGHDKFDNPEMVLLSGIARALGT